jgi:nucleoid-associated protein YgaU
MFKKTAKAFLTIAALLAAMIWLTGGKGVQYAIEQRTHTVSAGQTVWGIATKYFPRQNKYRDIRYLVDDIGKANHLPERSWNIRPGDVLIIPLAKEVRK